MKKEKIPYLIIGDGKLARHLGRYFSLLGIRYLSWSRKSNESLEALIHSCVKILIAVSDDAIDSVLNDIYPHVNPWQTIIHFSGALSFDTAESAHPLMTFSSKYYDEAVYREVKFITVKGRKTFPELFPELPNEWHEINGDKKTLYHALVSMAGNHIYILLKAVIEELNELGVHKKALEPYIKRTIDNLFHSENSLTGAFARNDLKTIEAHRKALAGTKLINLYDEFHNFYFERGTEIENDS